MLRIVKTVLTKAMISLELKTSSKWSEAIIGYMELQKSSIYFEVSSGLRAK